MTKPTMTEKLTPEDLLGFTQDGPEITLPGFDSCRSCGHQSTRVLHAYKAGEHDPSDCYIRCDGCFARWPLPEACKWSGI